MVGEMWRQLSDEDRQPYEDMAANDKMRASAAMEEYVKNKPEGAVESKKSKKSKVVKDPNAPKKPVSNYIQFRLDNFARIKQAHPGADSKGLSDILVKEFHAAKENPDTMAKMERDYEKRKSDYQTALQDYLKNKTVSPADDVHGRDDAHADI